MTLKSVKHQKAPLGRSVSTHFVADCRWGPRVVTAGRAKSKARRAECLGDLGGGGYAPVEYFKIFTL